MPVQPSYPGVYIEEIPSGARTITGVSTSVTGFVGRSARGDVSAPIRCFGFADFERRCGGLWAGSELGHAVQQFFANGGSEALISRVTTGATVASTTASGLALAAASPGAWGANLRLTISHGTPGSVDATTGDNFHLVVHEVDPAIADFDRSVRVQEDHRHVSVDPASPRHVSRVLESSALVRATAVPATRPAPVTRQAFGSASDGSTGDLAAYQAAVARLEQADVLNLVCIPPPAVGQDVNLAVWTDALALCERKRAVLLVDPPTSWADYEEAAALEGGYDSLRRANAVFYYPQVEAVDALQENRVRTFAPSGFVAGVIARTDATRGVWKAPAGDDAGLRGVSVPSVKLADGENGLLNSRGVNALRAMGLAGPVVWGARTAMGADVMASEWKYLPVRRLALFIEESLQRGTRWAVFEPNDEPLWAQLRLAIGSFMQQLYRQGAFKGAKPSDAYLVRCDASTTTQADIDRGIVNILVGFAPLKPAEFVVLKFQQLAGQASVA